MDKENVMRQLITVWTDFEANLNKVPIIDKINRGKFRLESYKSWLLNHRQQVIEGGRWISLAASNIDNQYADLRSTFITHANTEHRDYKMLEKNYVAIGGSLDEIQSFPPNIGTQALSAYMFYQAGKANPFQLLGAMFIIEGLGQRKANEWGNKIKNQLKLSDEQVSFLLYHGENDEHHMEEFDAVLSEILPDKKTATDIVNTAKVVAKLYIMQLEAIN